MPIAFRPRVGLSNAPQKTLFEKIRHQRSATQLRKKILGGSNISLLHVELFGLSKSGFLVIVKHRSEITKGQAQIKANLRCIIFA